VKPADEYRAVDLVAPRLGADSVQFGQKQIQPTLAELGMGLLPSAQLQNNPHRVSALKELARMTSFYLQVVLKDVGRKLDFLFPNRFTVPRPFFVLEQEAAIVGHQADRRVGPGGDQDQIFALGPGLGEGFLEREWSDRPAPFIQQQHRCGLDRAVNCVRMLFSGFHGFVLVWQAMSRVPRTR